MYVNNLPFSETLQQAQTDLYDIDTLLLKPLKKMEKITKRKKIAWTLVSGTEHAIGITFGIMASIDIYNQRYGLALFYIALLSIGAATGFNSGKISTEHNNNLQKLRETINSAQNAVDSALPEQLHEIAEIVREQNKQKR